MATDCVPFQRTDEVAQQEALDYINVNVAKMDGSVIECNVADNCKIADLINIVDQAIGVTRYLDKAHRGHFETVLITESGTVLEQHLRLCDYNVGAGGTLSAVLKKNVKGHYTCWLELDTSNLPHIDVKKFDLEIQDHFASINGTPGCITEHGDTEIEVALNKPVKIVSDVPRSRPAFFLVTGCRFKFQQGDYSQGWWYPIEGKLVGRSSCERAGKFKARFRHGYEG